MIAPAVAVVLDHNQTEEFIVTSRKVDPSHPAAIAKERMFAFCALDEIVT